MSDTEQKIRRKRARIEQVLVYYDGPQVLTLTGSRKSKWLCLSVPPAGVEFPIFCVQVTGQELARFMRGHVDLRYLFRFREVKDYRLADLRSEQNGELLLEAVEPPEEWFPAEGFFMDPDTEDNAHQGRRPSDRMLTIPIDGEWEFPEFAAFSDYVSDCYSFLYSIDAARRGVASRETIASLTQPLGEYPWKGGASPLHMYRDLYWRTPANDRLNVKKIAYASAGEIALEGSPLIFLEITAALWSMQRNYYDARDEYTALRTFLSKQGLLRASRDTVRGAISTQDIVRQGVLRLSELIGFSGVETLHQHTEKNWVMTAKILLSYHRRLRKLFKFYAEGRASNEVLTGYSDNAP